MLLSSLLKRMIRVGTLNIIDATGRVHKFAGAPGPEATIRLHDKALHYKLFVNPDLYLGEAYMDGTLTMEDCDLRDFLEVAVTNLEYAHQHPMYSFASELGRLMRWAHQYNPISRSRDHVAHHYDLSVDFYDLFLDRDRQYSCGYFRSPDESLEQAQLDKRLHIASKLLLKPGQKVLDIGCGWGGLSTYLAKTCDVNVTGLTLSTEQIHMANRIAAEEGLERKVDFHLRDYREQTGLYDRIVSVGMFEHVGVRYYKTYFDKVRELLTDDGVCLLHSIGRMSGPASTAGWIRKYIFPGGYSPALSEVMTAVERAGLWVTDIEILRVHYAETLLAWQRRFQANRAKAAAMFDERFCRMWEFYLAASESVFRYGDHFVFQMQIAKKRDAVPLTRDYIPDWERAHGIEAEPVRLRPRAG
jgi:cyclopropane-fatty-acyl-phospholipid synthase